MKLRSGRITPVTQVKFISNFTELMQAHEKNSPFIMDDNLFRFCLDLCRFTDKNRFYIHENKPHIKRFRDVLYDRTDYFLDRIRADEFIYDLTNGGEEDICHFLLATRELSVNPYWQFPQSKLFRCYNFV